LNPNIAGKKFTAIDDNQYAMDQQATIKKGPAQVNRKPE